MLDDYPQINVVFNQFLFWLGTGKTFIGLEILTALVRNTDEQILVICYTNHALDQFLTGVLAITEDIVRMGNQSKNELLDKYNAKQLLETIVSDKRMKNCFYKAKCEYAELMEQFESLQGKKGSENDAKSVESEILDVQVMWKWKVFGPSSLLYIL